MHKLKEMLAKEYIRLRSIKLAVDERLSQAPEGTLKITTSNKNMQFIQCFESDKKRRYIKKEYLSIAASLAQKAYDKKVKKIVDRRIKQIEVIAKEYEDNEIDKLYDRLSATRRSLIQPVEKPWEQRIAEWKSIPYVGKEFDESIPIIYSKKGERVRSKSEKIIADTFYELGIEYKYECPLTLKGYGIVYPDFTILRKKDGREVYWEHDGKMDDPKYSEKAVRKINSYIANSIFPGDNLILSFEATRVVINDRIIKMMIDKYLY